jgi:hypothetical protein
MSRAYRIKVSETLTRTVHVEDGVTFNMELLDILPEGRMAELLKDELEALGFEEDDEGVMRRVDDNGVEVAVEPVTRGVTIRLADALELDLETEVEGVFDDDITHRADADEQLRDRATARLERQARDQTERRNKEVTKTLEGCIGGLQAQLDRVSNKVTREALKEKAATMGDVQEISEDEQSGNLRIRVRV